MAATTVQIRLKINFPVILITVLFLHAIFLLSRGLANLADLLPQKSAAVEQVRRPLQIKNIRTVGNRESKIKNSTYLSKNDSKSLEIPEERFSAKPSQSNSNVSMKPQKPSLSLKDLSVAKQAIAKTQKTEQRPGTRPGALPSKPKAISAISLKGSQIQEFAQASDASALSGDPRTAGLSNSDILVNLEVPEGVNPDELNKYELMFYGFQRRTAINYINSFYKNLDKFQRENPHMQFPMTDTKQVMTGRLTYDEKGNIKQIKMIRWTNVSRLQNFFEDVLKDMDTLHNPPQALWERDGEFSIFFSLVING